VCRLGGLLGGLDENDDGFVYVGWIACAMFENPEQQFHTTLHNYHRTEEGRFSSKGLTIRHIITHRTTVHR